MNWALLFLLCLWVELAVAARPDPAASLIESSDSLDKRKPPSKFHFRSPKGLFS